MTGSPDHEHLHADAARALADEALTLVRASGERLTGARRGVITVLANHHDHLTADQVATLVAETGIHRATVYRTLETLAGLGIVTTRVLASGATAYHLATVPTGHAHLHGICQSCGAVVALPADLLDDARRRAQRAADFTLDPVQSTVHGLCGSCARAG